MINRYSQPIQNSLEQYVPLPFAEMAQAGAMIQQRGDIAEQKRDEAETGLRSVEALTPAYKDFVNKFADDYNKESDKLLTESGLNTSNPEYKRSINKLNLKFLGDSRLKTVIQGNKNYLQNEADARRMQLEGKMFIKPKGNGLDKQGNITSNLGQVEFVNTLDEWSKAGGVAHSSIEDNGKGWKSNENNLNRWRQSIMGDVDGQKKLIQAYISQGYDPKQANQAVQTQIRGMINQYGVRSDRDYAYDNFQLNLRKLKTEENQQKQESMPNLLPFDTEVSNVINDNFRKPQLDKIDSVISKLRNNGGLEKDNFVVEATKENLEKYKNNSTQFTKTFPGGDGSVGASRYQMLRVNKGNNKKDLEILRNARQALGVNFKGEDKNGNKYSDKTILNKYRDALSNDNTVYNFMKPNNADYLKAINTVKIGNLGQNIGSEYTLFNAEGKAVTNDNQGNNPLENIKGFEFAGVNPTPFGKYEYGTIKINAVDDKNNPVQILKPLNKDEQKMFSLPNKIYKAFNSDKDNKQLAKEPIQTESGNVYIQKGISGGKEGMKAYLQTPDGNVREIDINQLIDGVMSKYYNGQQPYENLK